MTVLLGCLIVYTLYHAVGGSSGSLTTTPVKTVTDTTVITGEGWLFRDEEILTGSERGLVNVLTDSGTKAKKNTALAEVYYPTDTDGESLSDLQIKLNTLNRQIALLEESLLSDGAKLSDLSTYRSNAKEALSEIRKSIRSGNWSGVSDAGDSTLISLNRYASLLSGEDGIKKTLDLLTAERNGLLTGEKVTVRNENGSAYYYDANNVDGLEKYFQTNVLGTLTVDTFRALQQTEATASGKTVVGKLCYGYTWYLVFTLPADVETVPEVDTLYRVTFPENGDRVLKLTCTAVRDAEDGSGEKLVILRSDATPADFSFLRSQTVEIVMDENEGLYIPEQAIVKKDGDVGVYIFKSGVVAFRRISVTAERDGYYLADESDSEPDKETAYLAINDLMILSGKNLYEGKVYKQ